MYCSYLVQKSDRMNSKCKMVVWKTPSIAATSLNKCKIGICRSIEKCFVFQFPDYIHICLYLQRIYQHGSISSFSFFFHAIFFLLLFSCDVFCCCCSPLSATTQERIRQRDRKKKLAASQQQNIIE